MTASSPTRILSRRSWRFPAPNPRPGRVSEGVGNAPDGQRLNVEGSVADTEDKLRHLLPHWVEHNASHLESFRQWQRRAQEQGFTVVADALRETVDAAEQTDAALRRAVEALRDAG